MGMPGPRPHVCCAACTVVHLEGFHDSKRIEHLLFDGARRPEMGPEFKRQDTERYAP